MEKVNVMHIRDSGGMFGGERVILTLGKNMDRQRFDFGLLCMRGRGRASEGLIEKGRELGIDVDVVDVKGKLDFGAVLKIRRVLQEKKVAVLHSHDFKANFYGALASANTGIRRVTTAHGSTRDSLLKRAYLTWDERFTYRFYDRIIVVSEDLREHVKRQGINGEKVIVIQNGLDLELLENSANERADERTFPVPEGCKVFGVIGRLYPDKGHRVFVDAFSKVKREFPNILGLIVGDGPGKEEIEAQIRELGLQESVFMCGVRSDMKTVYGYLNYLIIPSFREGLPYVLLESMANRIPVIASSVGEIPSIIKDGINGLLVQAGDAVALENCMTRMLENPERAKGMAERAHKLFTQEFTAEKMVRKTESVYGSLFQ
jgi:glycosyltransferase involved in cell wall biosynthesis